jgi:hypothetical protein
MEFLLQAILTKMQNIKKAKLSRGFSRIVLQNGPQPVFSGFEHGGVVASCGGHSLVPILLHVLSLHRLTWSALTQNIAFWHLDDALTP